MAVSIYPGYEVVSATEVTGISFESVKARLRIDASDTSLDAEIPGLIIAARQYVERYTKCIICSSRNIYQYFDGWPEDRILSLSFSPINFNLGTPAIEYLDDAGIWQVLDDSTYQIDPVSFPHRVFIPDSVTLPSLLDGVNTVKVFATYGVEEEPTISPLVQCIYFLVAAWLNNSSHQDISDLNYVHTILDQYTVR